MLKSNDIHDFLHIDEFEYIMQREFDCMLYINLDQQWISR